jgi:hypothetical protein
METEISKSKFKAQALEISRRVELTGESVVITDHGTFTLILRKYTTSSVSPQQCLKDSVIRYEDPLAPMGEGDWAVMA